MSFHLKFVHLKVSIIWFIAVNIAECNLAPGNAYKEAVTRVSRTTTISSTTGQLHDQAWFRTSRLLQSTQAPSIPWKWHQSNKKGMKKKCGKSSPLYGGPVARFPVGRGPEIGEFPWQAAVLLKSKEGFEYLCGGTILAEQWILTAAHCLEDVKPDDLKVAAGVHDLLKITSNDEYLVDKITTHEDYRTGKKSGPIIDIALLHLSSPIDLNKSDLVNTVCLPEQGEVFTKVVEMSYWNGYELGSEEQNLKAVEFFVRSNEECSLNYAALFRPNEMVCAKISGSHKDVCGFTDGNSVVKQQYSRSGRRATIVGVKSFSFGCGRKGKPMVFTRVSNYINWIKENMQ